MNEEDLMWDNIEADVKGSSALNPMNGLTAEQAIAQAPSIAQAQAQQQAEAEQARAALAQQAQSQEKQSVTQQMADFPDAAIGSMVAGQAANALTPKLQQEAIERGATKMLPFITRQVAPRVMGAMVGSSAGPVGTIAGAVAPEIGYQAIDALSSAPVAPKQVATPQVQYAPRMDTLAKLNPQMHAGQLLTEAAKGPVMPEQYSSNFLRLP